MQQHAHLAWLRGSGAILLTLLTQWTGAATADAGPIHHAQAAISALFVAHAGSVSVQPENVACHRAGEQSLGR